MSTDNDDISESLIAKSDQLNADDLIGRDSITVTITATKYVENDKQPLILTIDGGWRPWKPCKSMRRVIVEAWGPKHRAYVGRRVKLWRDPEAEYGGAKVGGVRLLALSHIAAPFTFPVSEKRGVKKQVRFDRLPDAPEPAPRGAGPKTDPRPLEAFVAGMAKNLDLPAHDLTAWALSAGIDLATLSRAGQDELWKGLRAGGRERADFDAWCEANPVEDGDDELPEGEGLDLDGAK